MDDASHSAADQNTESVYDLNFRPITYWPGPWDNRYKMSRITGTVRRGMAELLHESTGTAIPDDPPFEEQLTDEARKALGSIHPMFMGGEYLPPLEDGEVQIARLEYVFTTTYDVKAVLARPTDTGISYRIVDEYGDECDDPGRFTFSPTHTEAPLSLGELVHLLEQAEDSYLTVYSDTFVLDYFLSNDYPDRTADEWVGAVIAVSDFYPGLGAAFDDLVRKLAAEYVEEDDSDNDFHETGHE